MLAGTAYFTGCAWFYTTVIGTENGVRTPIGMYWIRYTRAHPTQLMITIQLGFNVATFAGASIFTACHFQEQNAAAAYNGVGQAFIVLGALLFRHLRI